MADINGDGYKDICFASNLLTKTQLYLNNKNGTFSDITASAGIGFIDSHKVVFGDINNDGYPDLYICRGAKSQDRLFLNNGDATFDDITDGSGINGYGSSDAIFADIDNDGDLDLFISWSNTESKSELFINNGNGTFTNKTSASGLGFLGLSTTSRFIDIDNDDDIDLFVVVNGHLWFYLNYGAGLFTQDTPPIIGSRELQSFSLSDIDLDGDTDLLLLRGNSFELFRNNGNGFFEMVASPHVLQRIDGSLATPFFADIDNVSGDDIICGAYLLRNSSQGLFENYETELSGNNINVSAVDIDGDGDNDIVTAGYSSITKVLRNQTDNNNWLKVKPVGVVSNRDAIGAKVYIYSNSNKLVGFQEVSSEKPVPLCFGVGSSGEYKVVVHWPKSGLTNIVEHVATAQTITVAESETDNHPPVLDPIGNKAINEDKLLEFQVTASDPEGNPLTYSALNLPNGAKFRAPIKTFLWIPTPYQAGVYDVTFTVSDGCLTDSKTITINVSDTIDEVKPGESIQAAIDNTPADGSVHIDNGLYEEDISIQGKPVSIIGRDTFDTIPL